MKVKMQEEDLKDYIGYMKMIEDRNTSHLEALLNRKSLFQKITLFFKK
jgi:hypothetical protein